MPQAKFCPKTSPKEERRVVIYIGCNLTVLRLSQTIDFSDVPRNDLNRNASFKQRLADCGHRGNHESLRHL